MLTVLKDIGAVALTALGIVGIGALAVGAWCVGQDIYYSVKSMFVGARDEKRT